MVPTKIYSVESIELFRKQVLIYQLSGYIMNMRLKCEVRFEKIELNPLLGKTKLLSEQSNNDITLFFLEASTVEIASFHS